MLPPRRAGQHVENLVDDALLHARAKPRSTLKAVELLDHVHRPRDLTFTVSAPFFQLVGKSCTCRAGARRKEKISKKGGRHFDSQAKKGSWATFLEVLEGSWTLKGEGRPVLGEAAQFTSGSFS